MTPTPLDLNLPQSGELFAGVGGLGLAVDEVFGTRPAWFAEFESAPSKVLDFRYPGVPNIGDVTKADWASLPHVNVLAGGFPCQDVSLAGRRRGLKEGTRSGLWSEFARAIDTIRPDWVVIENVRGLLSANAAGDVEPCPWCLGTHGNEHPLRALGAVLGDLADLGFDAEWQGVRAADVGAPHGRFRVFILAWPRERTVAHTGGGRGRGWPAAPGRGPRARSDVAADWAGAGADRTPEAVTLLPTPDAYDGARGGFQHPDKRRARNHSVTLQDAAEHLPLLGTPRTAQGVMNELREPDVISNPRGRLEDQIALLPGAAVDHEVWGQYHPAVTRWEAVAGRDAPDPVRMDGRGGKARLNPELPEWMMGWPAGWVTDPAIGLTRNEQLKCAGNGVVPQQAAYALRLLLARPGVPAVDWGPAT